MIAGMYATLDLGAIRRARDVLLRDHRLDLAHPLFSSDGLMFSRRGTRLVQGLQRLPAIMQVPVPAEGDDFAWVTVTGNDAAPFSGPVYSMDVEKDQHYIADGIATHNCWYAVWPARATGPAAGTDDPLVDPEPGPGRRHRPWHPEAGRVHAPADPEQLQPRPGGLRAVLRIGDDAHCRRDDGAGLPRGGARPGLRGRGGAALAGVHGQVGGADGSGEVLSKLGYHEAWVRLNCAAEAELLSADRRSRE